MRAEILSEDQLRIVRFCAEECERQRSGEVSVACMVDAWNEAMLRCTVHGAAHPDLRDVLELGRLVEPEVNKDGFRKVGVRVGWSVKGPWQQVPRQIDNLLDACGRLSPSEWYRQYEEVHPFRDGNGRTGSLLFNWLSGTLANPSVPPNFWDDHVCPPWSESIRYQP